MTIPLDEVEVAHARFNAAKTLGESSESEFETQLFGAIYATRDRARTDPYYNRVLLPQDEIDHLREALAWVREGAGPRQVRVDTASGSYRNELGDFDLRPDDTLLWLTLPDTATAPATQRGHGRELSPRDWPAIRRLVEAHGAIDDARWLQRREYYCTPTFRWFGVFDDGDLVSAASLWQHAKAAILGSAFTQPSHRNRGFHQQLLALRCASATPPVIVDVEPETTSHRNCVAAGFVELEQRQVWIG